MSACIYSPTYLYYLSLPTVSLMTLDTYMYFLESSWDITVGILIMIKLVNISTHSYW